MEETPLGLRRSVTALSVLAVTAAVVVAPRPVEGTQQASIQSAVDAAPATLSSGVDLSGVYTGDAFWTAVGGVDRGFDYLGDLSATLELDLERLVNWRGATLFAYGLANHGATPSTRVGDFQVASNIEAPQTAKLYELWIEQDLFGNYVSVLGGLYDINSEFDVIETAGLFVNSSFGMGAEFAQAGVNGPSIFPTTSLGVRVAAKPARQLRLQVAVLDGVPGDPNDPTGTHVALDGTDGLLVAFEVAGYRGVTSVDTPGQPGRRAGTRPRRIGRGDELLRYVGKFAVGGWWFTRDFDHLERRTPSGEPVVHAGNWGLYALGEILLAQSSSRVDRTLRGFARLGVADSDVNPLAAYVGGGLVATGWIDRRPEDRVGLGVATAIVGSPYRRVHTREPDGFSEAEVAVELTYRARITPWFGVQPDLQYIVQPAGAAASRNALVLALRVELSL